MLKWLERFTGRSGAPLDSAQLESKLAAVRAAIARKEARIAEIMEILPLAVFDDPDVGAADQRGEIADLRGEIESLRTTESAVAQALAEQREIEAEAALKLRSEEAAARRAARREIAERLDAAVDMVATITMELHAAGIHASNLNQLGPAIASALFGRTGGKIAIGDAAAVHALGFSRPGILETVG